MKKMRLNHAQLPDSIIHHLSNRDAVLWVGQGFDESSEIAAICDLIQLPWRMVLCESKQGDFAQAVESLAQSTDDQFTRVRGFIHLVASNPEGLTLPPRALPVFLLNGRADATDASESSNRAGMGQMLRRLNMLNMLVTAKPTSLVVLTRNDEQQIGQLADLWKDGFRSLLSIVSASETDGERIDEWLSQPASPPAVDFCLLPLEDFTRDIVNRTRLELPEKRLVIRMRASEQKTLDVDITRCELPEQPVLDRYDIIKVSDLRVLQPEDLSQTQFTAFFDKTLESWAPYGAGLPWERNASPRRKTTETLKRLSRSGSEQNRILFIASESGAGGTTLARSIAFSAASEGFPTLVAKSLKFRPDATELASFLFSVRQQFQADSRVTGASDTARPEDDDSQEVPWLIVFDVQHWDGREAELRNFMAELTRSGRPVVILAVTGPEVSEELRNSARSEQLEVLSHELDQDEALDLGKHLNRFLKPLGKEKADSEWLRFFETHRPNMSTSVASFWIALEFWLKGHLDLSESIQSWLYRQFKGLDASDDLRCLLLEIAALSIERQPLPEGLMAAVQGEGFPLSLVLEKLRTDAPALALVREAMGSQRQWAMAHDLLGRYLVSSTYFDRRMLEQLSLSAANDPVHLRLLLLRRIATRSDIARKAFLPLALELPVNILKLDFGGNTEFFQYWRDVIDILKAMPQSLRDSNRTFNHHVAISCRRVVKMKEYFDATPDEKRDLLRYAISRLEYAINSLDRTPDDESDLNLFNSLSLAYQDLAELEQSQGASDADVRELRAKAEEAARRAHDAGPSNSYVLETMARNVLQNGELYPEDAVQSASEALGFIYQALSLDRSELRQAQLTSLANRALRLLRSSESSERVEQLCAGGNPLGLLAKAWLVLTDGVEVVDQRSLDQFPAENVIAAFAVLGESTEGASWLLLRFRYDLLTVTEPYAFDAQLNLLDELEGTGYRMPYQLQLEQAILLYQRHRPHDANIRFQSLRQELKRYDVIVSVPKRLQWLLTDDAKDQRICNAVVVSDTGYRARAKVRDLKDAVVPFIPQEFRKSRMGSRETFKCCISFGPMGPFIKPPLKQGVGGGPK
jgi:hypothetical protein